jgi:hypothetical protein
MPKEITCSAGITFYTDVFNRGETSERRATIELFLSQYCLAHCKVACQAQQQGVDTVRKTITTQERTVRKKTDLSS